MSGGLSPSVLHICTRPVGGAAVYATVLDRDLGSHGFRSQLSWGHDTLDEGPVTPASGRTPIEIPHLQRALHPVADVRASHALARVMRAYKPSIVHTNQAKAGILGRRAARRARVPVVVHTYHGHVLEGYFSPLIARGFVAAERWAARHADALVAVSAAVRDELVALGIGREEQWRVIPIGLDLDRFLTPVVDKIEARTRLGLPPDAPVVGIIGRLAPIKDHKTFLDAAQIVASHNPDARFVVAGDGPLVGELRAKAGPQVTFCGHVTDLPSLMPALDIVVCTSRNEGTPTSLIEAAAAGLPVVSTDVGGVRDIVLDGESGLLVPAGSPPAVAEAIGALLARRDRAQMGEAGRDIVRDRFSSARLVRDVAALYKELLDRSAQRGD